MESARSYNLAFTDIGFAEKHIAAGEAIGGIHGGSYIGGNSVGSSLTLGMVAGKKAAASK